MFLLTVSLPRLAGPLPERLPGGEAAPGYSFSESEAPPALDTCLSLPEASVLDSEGWRRLPQARFWRQLLDIGPDTVVVNRASDRSILAFVASRRWNALGKRGQKALEDSLRQAQGIPAREEIYFTSGRAEFYRIRHALPQIQVAGPLFEAEGVDPWYAQSILLIESPGQLQYSSDGAFGPFQLMKDVARDMGLQVDRQRDERADLRASAGAAARLIRSICIPYAREMCEQQRIPYVESDLWFKLLVMHVYHAGAGNVRRALKKTRMRSGGQELITRLWQTEHRRFGNASQNYTQILLAAWMKMEDIVRDDSLACAPRRPSTR